MQSSFVKRPYRSQERPPPNPNIFTNSQAIHLPAIKQLARDQDQDYHLVGPAHLRKQIIQEQYPQSLSRLESLEERRSLPELTTSLQNSTILRESVLSKLGKSEFKALTRDKRNLDYYRDYQQIWAKSSRRIRDTTGGIHPTLIEGSVQRLQVIPNPQKQQLLKNYVNTFWEMSLRNNNYILKRHIKGEKRYDEVEMEGLLLSDEGTKMVEKAIPKLPIERLRRTDHKEFALTGRNKLACQSQSCDPSIASQYTNRLSKAMTDGAALDRNKEILKMEYDSHHSFLKQETVGE